MPKENVYCAANRDDNPQLSWRAEVQWTGGTGSPHDGDGFVMLGTVNPKSQFRWNMIDGSEDKVDGESLGSFDGWFVSLDRAGINRLIRALRRARDQAYGADA